MDKACSRSTGWQGHMLPLSACFARFRGKRICRLSRQNEVTPRLNAPSDKGHASIQSIAKQPTHNIDQHSKTVQRIPESHLTSVQAEYLESRIPGIDGYFAPANGFHSRKHSRRDISRGRDVASNVSHAGSPSWPNKSSEISQDDS